MIQVMKLTWSSAVSIEEGAEKANQNPCHRDPLAIYDRLASFSEMRF
jgi:hypothetical protein